MNPEQELGKILSDKRMTIAVAESVTGGLIGDIITNVPGSTKYFEGGVIVYSYESKKALLGVKDETLRLHGAVSELCALEMAEGVRGLFKTSVGVSVTGIAGPTGAVFGKPIGLVYFAFDDGNVRMTDKMVFPGERDEIKRAAAEHLVVWALEIMQEEGSTSFSRMP